jgi:predicted metal-dependent HD superfamily phosphohydrolase
VHSLPAALVRDGLALYSDLAFHGHHHPYVVAASGYRLAMHPDAPPVNLVLVEAGILLHDAGYRPGAPDNEAVAAAHAHRILGAHGWTPPPINRVGRIIQDTEHHQPSHLNVESCLVSDADMAGFCAPYEEFAAGGAAFRTEYLDAGADPDVLDAKIQVLLEGWLADAVAARLFRFPVELDLRHARAVMNLDRALHEP